MSTVWVGNAPTQCDMCDSPIEDIFFDVRLPKHGGVWANVCADCFKTQGCTLGVGYGQKYERRIQYVCVEGGRDSAKERKARASEGD